MFLLFIKKDQRMMSNSSCKLVVVTMTFARNLVADEQLVTELRDDVIASALSMHARKISKSSSKSSSDLKVYFNCELRNPHGVNKHCKTLQISVYTSISTLEIVKRKYGFFFDLLKLCISQLKSRPPDPRDIADI